jgi:tripartite-type tricarboxylate transporter receptor subunit TctC
MNITGMRACGRAAIVVATLLAPIVSYAQDYPSQQMKFIVGFAAGSGADTVTRFMAEKFKTVGKANVVVENRPGAAGQIAVEAVARSKPDGYTFLFSTATATAAAMHLYKNPSVDVTKAFRIVAPLSKQGFMIVVDAKSPIKSIAELTAVMKQKGEKGNYAVAAPSGIVLGELYKSKAGLQTTQVRFKTASDSLNELASGAIDFGSIDPQVSLAQAKQGKLRILAISTGQRLKSSPDVPTMHEAGVTGMDLTGWWSIMTPAATPDAIVNKVNGWVKEILATEEAQKFFLDTGGETFYLPAAEAHKLFLEEEKRWGEYVRIAKIEKQ